MPDALLRGGWVVLIGGVALAQFLRLLWRLRHLAAAWLGLRPARAPDDYVRSLFDGYAASYDDHLLIDLAYAVPNGLRDLVGERLDGRAGCRILDLGCGTGICGPLFRRLADYLEGVDLSSAMLERAARRQVYDALHEAEMTAFLGAAAGGLDLCIAADVLVYQGDLGTLLRAVAGALKPGGLLAFSVEHATEPPFRLQRNGRYAHHPAHVRAAAAAAGLVLQAARSMTLRRERGRPVEGDLYLFALNATGWRDGARSHN
jgi:predicted TPR repeat methyltransferase